MVHTEVHMSSSAVGQQHAIPSNPSSSSRQPGPMTGGTPIHLGDLVKGPIHKGQHIGLVPHRVARQRGRHVASRQGGLRWVGWSR